MVKNLFAASVAVLCLLIFSCAGSKKSAKTASGTWQETPVAIDGKNNDWPAPYPFYDDKGHLGYAVSNDKDNLYVTVEAGDPMTIMKLLKEGFTVFIDTANGKSQAISVSYPMPSGESDMSWAQRSTDGKTGENQFAKQNRASRMAKNVDQAHAVSFSGFRGECNGATEVKQKNACGIEVKMAIDEFQSLVWELKVPFKSFYKEQLIKADEGKPMSICLATNGIKRPSSAHANEPINGAGMASGGMGGGMGRSGAMRGGGGGMHSGNVDNSREQLYQSTKTWVKIGLAYKQ